jgi:hypothetical protein
MFTISTLKSIAERSKISGDIYYINASENSILSCQLAIVFFYIFSAV